ncbi:TolC family outer membrane protein [Methylocystis sp. Sn-Cys]|uniref:TolC family outer membrane protein n=1 Tax=Methylocystis sp. Sn-Cys TaxID=1701263 RepID=UPI0019215E1A|nr:TolC family outer membrane protein [Methylocystis sp. Sn-Cys]MBL1257754.1 TolC family outer membrane protein [Methylocystis sp. Sn-Cys]
MGQARVFPFGKPARRVPSIGGHTLLFILAACSWPLLARHAHAETLTDALSEAYLTNPQLNAQRASTRSVDENLPMARGTLLPTVNLLGNYAVLQQNLLTSAFKSYTLTQPAGAGLLVNLNIFNGFRGLNGIDQAKAQIFQSRQILRNAENIVLANAAAAYLNVLHDAAVYKLRDNFVRAVANQVVTTKGRFLGGEVTKTDIFQAESYLARGKLDRSTSTVNLQSSISAYSQLIGRSPNRLTAVGSPDRMLPQNVGAAVQLALTDHPAALAARYNVDIIELAVKIAEGELAPTVNLVGSVNQNFNYVGYVGAPNERLFQGMVGVQVNVPVYEGGIVYARARQAKERLGEAKFLYHQQINEIKQSVEAAWAAWNESSKLAASAREQARSAESALAGIRQEAKISLRTTWDILNAQLTLLSARIALVDAQRNRILSGFGLLASMGQLSAEKLALDVPVYDATTHYEQIKDQWFGLEAWNPPAVKQAE